jgi:hypothetical protein
MAHLLPHDHRWQGLPVTTTVCPLPEVPDRLPVFDRLPFGLASASELAAAAEPSFAIIPPLSGVNRYLDLVVRQPHQEGEVPVPVGTVSHSYTLIQHREVAQRVLAAVRKLRIAPRDLQTEVTLTPHGERMRMSVLFPTAFDLDLGGDDRMGLRLECFNSVDGSFRFMTMLGWFRFVCANGMIVGIRDLDFRQRHIPALNIDGIDRLISDGLAAATADRQTYTTWRTTGVSRDRLSGWVNRKLATEWGVKAAVRTWHIVTSGHDVRQVDPFEKGAPTEKAVTTLAPVPGAVLPGDNVYAVAQALAWLAKERREVQEQVAWRQQIPQLVGTLIQ